MRVYFKRPTTQGVACLMGSTIGANTVSKPYWKYKVLILFIILQNTGSSKAEPPLHVELKDGMAAPIAIVQANF
jgi:hypothetical protein